MQKKKFRQFSCESIDDPIDESLQAFEVNVYNSILDTVIQSLSIRFEKHGQLYADFSCLDPNNFETNMPISSNLLSSIYEKITDFIPDITLNDLQNEYTDFMAKWSELRKLFCSNYEYNVEQSSNELYGKNKLFYLNILD